SSRPLGPRASGGHSTRGLGDRESLASPARTNPRSAETLRLGAERLALAREAGGHDVEKVGELLLRCPAEVHLAFRPAERQILLRLRHDLEPGVRNRVLASRPARGARRNADGPIVR